MRTALALTCGVLLAAGGAMAQNQNDNSSQTSQSQKTPLRQNDHATAARHAQRPGAEPMVAGVVTSVDPNGHELTLVAPAGAEVDVSRVGQTVFVERGVNLVAVKAPVGNSAQVSVDGQPSSLTNLKEGDVVRAAFDPNQQQFIDVRAVTPQEMRNDMSKARSDLRMSSSGSHAKSSSHAANQ
jgi:hypothetical protein